MPKRARKLLSPTVARELRKIRAAHPQLLDRPDAVAQMRRLAAIRCRFEEVTTLIEAAGGANPENLDLVAESRQLHRAAASIEKELKGWWVVPMGTDAFAVMAALRRQHLGLPLLNDGGVLIDGAVEPAAEPVRLPRN